VLSSLVYKVQKSENITKYEEALTTMARTFSMPLITKDSHGNVVEEYVHQYVMKIHPTSFCVFANDEYMTVETKRYLDEHWNGEPSYGDPKPLFGWSCSTANEGEHNGMTFDTSRKCGPLTILEKWCERANDRVVQLLKSTKQVTGMRCGMFEWPSVHLHRQANQCMLYSVKPTPEENIFHVQKRKATIKGKEHDVHFVDVLKVWCSGCTHFSQLRCICRHMFAVHHFLRSMKKNHSVLMKPDYSIENFCHKGYLVNKVVSSYRRNNTLHIPTRSTLMSDTVVLPSPNYRNISKKKKKDRPRFKDRPFANDRIRSNGEQPRTTSSRKHDRPKDRSQTISDKNGIRNHDSDKIYINELKAEFKPCPEGKHKTYRCSICQDINHNCATCPFVQKKDVKTPPNTIRPGIYVLGECPFTETPKMNSVKEIISIDYQY
jgi:hypothetical protein